MLVIVLLIISLFVFTIISVCNLFSAPELKIQNSFVNEKKLISVLIPARNEESNIEKCIRGAIRQDYQNKEIIVLDDQSTDNTYTIASSFKPNNINILKGSELPQDWLGKNWACHQLAKQANGEYLLFIDADVVLKPEVISSAIFELEKSNSTLLSIFPTQIIKSFGEYLIVPLMNWLLLTFLPLRFVYNSPSSAFVAANGQFMLWKKDDYVKIGGHERVKGKVVEDMELARLAKQNKLNVKTFLGGELVFCRMYNSFSDSYNGFQKNFYAGFSINPLFFFIIILFLLVVFLVPLLVISNTFYTAIPIILIIVTRTVVSIKSKQSSFINIILHPIQMVLMFWIGVISILKYKTNKLVWKQRKL